jgi:surfeit locus 1 family protein
VALNLGSRRFVPSLFASLLTVVGLTLTCYLGFWQLSRAEEKRALAQQYEEGETSTRTLDSDGSADFARYQSVTARGRFDSKHQVLLDNMPSASGQPGYRVLTPFALGEDFWVLVDRGWVPLGRTRDDLPQIDVDESERTISGRLDEYPQPGMRLAQTPVSVPSWPHVMNFPEHADLEAALDRRLDTRMIALDAAAPDGFARERPQRAGFGPDRHIAYAVQWFALGATMLVVYLLLNFKSNARHDDT